MKELLSAACFQTITESKLIQCTEIRYCVVLQDSVDSDAKVSLAGYQTEAEVWGLGFSTNIQNRIGYPCSFQQTRPMPRLLLCRPDSMFFAPWLSPRLKKKKADENEQNKNANVFLTRGVGLMMIGLHSSSQPESWYFIFCREADHSRAIKTLTPGPKVKTPFSCFVVWMLYDTSNNTNSTLPALSWGLH